MEGVKISILIFQLSIWFVLPYSGRTCSHPIQADEKTLSFSNFVSFSEALHKTKFHSFLRDNSITVHNWYLFEAFDLLQLVPQIQMLVIESSKTISHLYYYIFHLNPFNYSKIKFLFLSTCTNNAA